MEIKVNNIQEDRKDIFEKLIKTIRENITKGFSEKLSYGIPAWIVPHSLYPKGYY